MQQYKNEFIHHLFRSYGSCEETLEHLELLHHTGSLTNNEKFTQLFHDCNNLCGKLLRYIQAVDRKFEMPSFMKDPVAPYIEEYVESDELVSSQSSNPKPRTTQ
ncbi:MAG: four helix bundle protein [Ignavibacteriae bacterium]|nr:four helix bundle protein [Ignavibacteria bacterium]MBI3363776.1 four helix bundle protein [Ignavibacteriota bacterium]